MAISRNISAYFRKLGQKGKGEKKRRSAEYYAELSRKGVEARQAKKAAATVADKKKSEV